MTFKTKAELDAVINLKIRETMSKPDVIRMIERVVELRRGEPDEPKTPRAPN